MTDMELRLTTHAKEKMAKLAITKEQIKVAIQKGSKFKQTDGFLASYTCLKVAYKKLGDNVYKIKTVYVD